MADKSICSIDGCGKQHRCKGFCANHYAAYQKYGDPLIKRGPGNGVVAHYLQTVILPYEGADCLYWPHSRDNNGYPRINIGGKNHRVIRIVCEEACGSPPTPEHEAAHSCGNGHLGCVTKRHLSWKTGAENQADKLLHGTHNRGERCGRSKLTEVDVRKIRALANTLTLREIAAEFGVGQTIIHAIKHGKNWQWLQP